LILDGANRLAAAGALILNGGALKLANAGGANGQSFASLAVTDNSAIDLGLSSLTFGALGSVVGGKTLTITDYLASASPDYAFRLLGDFSGNLDFIALIAGTSIDGAAASYRFDGVYTDVTGSAVVAVSEPETYAMLLAGVALLGAATRRPRRRPAAAIALDVQSQLSAQEAIPGAQGLGRPERSNNHRNASSTRRLAILRRPTMRSWRHGHRS
jgi:PEP-CTERM motif